MLRTDKTFLARYLHKAILPSKFKAATIQLPFIYPRFPKVTPSGGTITIAATVIGSPLLNTSNTETSRPLTYQALNLSWG